MALYKDVTGTSGITAFESKNDSITIEYKNGSVYQYSDQTAGAANVGFMKSLAAAGHGLNSFINMHLTKAQAVRVR